MVWPEVAIGRFGCCLLWWRMRDGSGVGLVIGLLEGCLEGSALGTGLGTNIGCFVGCLDGSDVGRILGSFKRLLQRLLGWWICWFNRWWYTWIRYWLLRRSGRGACSEGWDVGFTELLDGSDIGSFESCLKGCIVGPYDVLLEGDPLGSGVHSFEG